jgi:hypothetical protein
MCNGHSPTGKSARLGVAVRLFKLLWPLAKANGFVILKWVILIINGTKPPFILV